MNKHGIRVWNWLGRIKLIPMLIACIISVLLPFSLPFRVTIGVVLYVFLFCITWRKADGKRVLPPYLW